ncbi:hypothetical protein CTI12_AA402180 [Artemisia annua]|uniref:Uncharacterized protein n=1 Tax=Artemisia annua TaxID=35608 RepID=A0A2U1MAE8_ARTAN|nr:hypothetical protein CTI12_AA402180 [Artemisia annua]
MTGDGVNDALTLNRADIGIAVADATDAARGASDIVLTEPRLTVIISAERFDVKSIRNNDYEFTAALYLQVSIVSQALIFVTRSRSWSYVELPGLLLLTAFCIAQLIYVEWQAWDNMLQNKAFLKAHKTTVKAAHAYRALTLDGPKYNMRPSQFLEEEKWPPQDQRKEKWLPITGACTNSTSSAPFSVSECQWYRIEGARIMNSQSPFSDSTPISNYQSKASFLHVDCENEDDFLEDTVSAFHMARLNKVGLKCRRRDATLKLPSASLFEVKWWCMLCIGKMIKSFDDGSSNKGVYAVIEATLIQARNHKKYIFPHISKNDYVISNHKIEIISTLLKVRFYGGYHKLKQKKSIEWVQANEQMSL